MQPSQDAVALVKAAEGLRLTAYHDTGKVLTIGYGHTAGVYPGMTITQDQADAFLAADLAEAAASVSRLVTADLLQREFDALVDFVFNLGAGDLMGSTLLRLLNRGDKAGAAGQFKYWVMDDGKPLPALIQRRAAEQAMFLGTPFLHFVTGATV